MNKLIAAAASAALLASAGLATTAKADPVLVGDPYLQPAQVGIYCLGRPQLLLVLQRLAWAGLVLVRLSLAHRLRLGRRLGLERLGRTRRWLVGLGHRPRLP